jgi:hypothetical protein
LPGDEATPDKPAGRGVVEEPDVKGYGYEKARGGPRCSPLPGDEAAPVELPGEGRSRSLPWGGEETKIPRTALSSPEPGPGPKQGNLPEGTAEVPSGSHTASASLLLHELYI